MRAQFLYLISEKSRSGSSKMIWFDILVPAFALMFAGAALLWAKSAGRKFDRESQENQRLRKERQQVED